MGSKTLSPDTAKWGTLLPHTEGVLAEGVADEVCLEERAHLSITWTGVVEDQEVHLEGGHVDQNREHDEAPDAGCPMPDLVALDNTVN